jgi:hypothetical protein
MRNCGLSNSNELWCLNIWDSLYSTKIDLLAIKDHKEIVLLWILLDSL